MDPITVAAAAQIILTGLEIYARHKNKPAGWVPTAEDWAELEAEANERTADWYKQQAKAAIPQSEIVDRKS